MGIKFPRLRSKGGGGGGGQGKPPRKPSTAVMRTAARLSPGGRKSVQSSIDNTTITTKQTAVSSKKKNRNASKDTGVPFHPDFVNETRVPSLPPLGLSTEDDAVEESGEDGGAVAFVAAGYNRGSRNAIDENNVSIFGDNTTGTGSNSPKYHNNGGAETSVNATSRQSDSVFGGLSKSSVMDAGVGSNTRTNGQQQKQRHSRDPSAGGMDASKLASIGTAVRDGADQDPLGYPLDPPEEQNAAVAAKTSSKTYPNPTKLGKSGALRAAMRREISKHRDDGIGNSARTTKLKNSKGGTSVVAAAGVAAGAGAGRMGLSVSRRSRTRSEGSQSRKSSRYNDDDDESTRATDDDETYEKSANEDNDTMLGDDYDEEVDSLHNSSFCSRGSNYRDYVDDGDESDDGTIESYIDDATFDDGTYLTLDKNENTWASWFGFTGGDDDESTFMTKETYDDEYSGVRGDKRAVKEQFSKDLARGEAKAGKKTSSEEYDREGRPLGGPKPLARRLSFRKNKNKGKEDRDMDKTVSTAETHAASRASSNKTADKKEDAGGDANKMADKDVRQRDIYCKKHGNPENLTIRQYVGVPSPNAPDHILVKVEASTVSTQDCVVRLKGDTNDRPNPCVPGFHVVGTVHTIGSDVNTTTFRHGDRIAALLPYGGGNAKYISVPMKNAILLPETATNGNVICLLANYMAAYQCLKLAKKDGLPLTNANVLITGGSGPVGQALVELALREGAKVYATAHKMHEEHLTKLGAKWFSVKPKKWLPLLEGKIDVVIDSLCVDGYESSYRALTPDGILVCNTSPDAAASLLHLQNDEMSSYCNAFDEQGLNVWWSSVKAKYVWNRAVHYNIHESYEKNPKMFAHELHYLICKLDRGEISPKVAGRVSLNQVPKAQKLIEKGLPNGTVVCLPWKKLDPQQKVKVEKADLSKLR